MRIFTIAGAVMAVLLTSGCETTSGASVAASDNPFFADWSGRAFGAPPFEEIGVEDYKPAFERGIAEQNVEIDAIAHDRGAPTFANTIEAYERSGALLTRVASVFYNLTGSDNTDELQAVQSEMAPILSRHSSEIALNPDLFARVHALYEQRASLGLNPEQMRLLERTHLDFVRSGAQLAPEGRTRLAAIDERLSELSTQFDQNLLADTAAWTLTLNGEADLAGLPDSVRQALLQTGRDLDREGAYVVTPSRSIVEPFLQYSTRRDLREQVFNAFVKRGDNANAYNNNDVIRETMQLRAERTRLLGFPTYAAYVLADSMAETPERAYGLMREVWTPAVAQANRERAEMQQLIDSEHGGFQLQPWDWRFYAERVRATRYNVSDTEVRPYLQFDRILEGAFYTANRLYGLSFTPRPDVPVYNPDVRAFEVKNREGATIGLYFLDPYMRPTKNYGAWMNNFRDQQRLDGEVLPIIVNVWNYNKPEAGQPTLLSWDDAETIFHEFGHALHGLLSNTTYASLSGTNVSRDYVEFPSQVMERWFSTDEILSRFAVNAETGQPMPAELIARIRAAETFNQGFITVEYLASAMLDMDIHMQTTFPDDFNADAFEAARLAQLGMPREILARHRLAHFGHIFAGGYSASYYGYLWAETLDADAYDAFAQTGDPFNPTLAASFARNVLSVGNTRPEMDSYIAFRGRPPTTEPLLRYRFGAPAPASARGAH
jgi:peptidyl-dipeptidase Dcp